MFSVVHVCEREGKVGEMPTLSLDEENNVKVVEEVTLSWRYFQRKSKRQHNNDSLTADRLKRDVKSMVTISALSEVNVGSYLISTYLFLYRSLFLSTILFNSQKWSNLRAQDIKALTTMQLKFIKGIVGVNSPTANSFIFLKLDVLPIEHEIAKRSW